MTMSSEQRRGPLTPRDLPAPPITYERLMRWGLVLLALLLVVVVASQALFGTSAPRVSTLTESDTGKRVTLNTGEWLEIKLSGNPTTGYQWLLDAADSAILKPLGEPAYKPDSALIGAGGIYTWRFTAVQSGQTTLHLVYRRPWEQATPPLRTFEVTVSVK